MANSVRPYAFAEMFKWRQGLDERFRGARYFYGVIILSTVVGIAMDFVGINPVKALFCTAVINGVLAPFFAYRHPSRRLQPAADAKSAKLDAVTRRRRTNAVAMFGAAIAMFVL